MANDRRRPQKLSFTVPGPPVPKERARVVRRRDGSGKSIGVTPSKTKKYEARVRTAAIAALAHWRAKTKQRWIATGEFELYCAFYFKDGHRRDLDNCIKSCGDALNGLLYDDDSQLAKLEAERFLRETRPRAEVTVQRRE